MTRPDLVDRGIPVLSESIFPEGDPDVENQINEAENKQAIDFFKQFHMPMITAAGIDLGDCRILEWGGGFGSLAYGTIKNITPKIYVATDVFPDLVCSLSENLPKWTDVPTAAALLDPQDPLFIKEGVFNVIQSHSVLHHVLDYSAALKLLYSRLASPGILILTEPCLEGYLYCMTVVRMFRKVQKIPDNVRLNLDDYEQFILERVGSERRNKEFLKQFGSGDKYIYSAYDLLDIAHDLGAKLMVQKDHRPLRGNLIWELGLRGADSALQSKFGKFLDEILPVGAENAYFSDLRQVFCFIKS